MKITCRVVFDAFEKGTNRIYCSNVKISDIDLYLYNYDIVRKLQIVTVNGLHVLSEKIIRFDDKSKVHCVEFINNRYYWDIERDQIYTLQLERDI